MAIVVVGTVFVDIKGFPLDNYIPDGRNAGTVKYVHGGVGRNIAEDIGRAGLRPKFAGEVDLTAEAQSVLDRLGKSGVDTSCTIAVEDGMGMWLAVFDNSGDVAGSISKRPCMLPLADYFKEHGDSVFSDADSIAVELDLEPEIIEQVFIFAKKYNIPVYAVVANMSIASERRELVRKTDCFVCNEQEAGLFFSCDFSKMEPEQLSDVLAEKVKAAGITSMIVTLGSRGSVFADCRGEKGVCPAKEVQVRDTTGAGDAYFAGVTAALTYGKTLSEAAVIGSRLASSVIVSSENVCPSFMPGELGIYPDKKLPAYIGIR